MIPGADTHDQPAAGRATRFTADAVVFAPAGDRMWVLLVRRAADHDTEPGKLALPGGHVDLGEDALSAAYRELAEETGLDLRASGVGLRFVDRFDAPGRDPRGRYVSDAYVAVLPHLVDVQGMDDADEAVWMPLHEALPATLAFDHSLILRAALTRAGSSVAP